MSKKPKNKTKENVYKKAFGIFNNASSLKNDFGRIINNVINIK